MTSVCLSYVMICLCIGETTDAYDCALGRGSRFNREGCTLIQTHTHDHVEHRGEKNTSVLFFFVGLFVSFPFIIFLNQCTLVMVTGSGALQQQQSRVKTK